MAGFFWWLVIGGTVGGLASHWFPGRPPKDLTMAMILGLVGAAAGGIASTQLLGTDLLASAFDGGSLMLSTAGSILAVAAYMVFAPRHEAHEVESRR